MSLSVFHGVIPDARICEQALLRDYTTMRVGGPADYLITPATEEELAAVLKRAKEENIPLCVMGNGSNLLFSDDGFRGAVIHLGSQFSDIRPDGLFMEAQAGALLSSLSRLAASNGLTGLEFASGIPGSVGGAVCMNAGAYGGEISQVLESARVLVDGRIERWNRDQLQLTYRHSAVMDADALVLSTRFQLSPGEKEQIEAQMNELNRRRREKQPLQYPSCGSFFKRPAGYFAGALIEQSGLKGFSVGDAQVSELHAGFIINRGHATASQIYALMTHVQQTVYQKFGVMLEPEVRLTGRFEL